MSQVVKWRNTVQHHKTPIMHDLYVLCLVFHLKQTVLILFLWKNEVVEKDCTSMVEKRAEGALAIEWRGPSLAYWMTCSRQLQHLVSQGVGWGKEGGIEKTTSTPGYSGVQDTLLSLIRMLALGCVGLAWPGLWCQLLLSAPWECGGEPLVWTHGPPGQYHCLQTPWHS